MKCNNKMLIILELMEAIDSAKIHDPADTYEMLNVVMRRCFAISEQYQKGNPFRKVIDFITTEIQIDMSAIAGEHFSEVAK
ncbi:MAG: hypothetical protein Q8S36_08370 [Sulfuricurvum sp.]|nr:hypothetical protein [Sulfuricurvum sp.]